MSVTRDYGGTAAANSNELLWHMLIAVVSVSALIWLTLGRRESAVVLVGNPTILATLDVIAALAFVGGPMGPLMRPIPVGASAAMVFSLLVAFLVTPWR